MPGGAWLCLPLLLVAMVAGVGAVRLAWGWAQTDRAAGQIADRLLNAQELTEDELAELVAWESSLPEPRWWNSEAQGLVLRAAVTTEWASSRGGDPIAQDQAGALLNATRHASPAHPGLRFATAWRASQNRSEVTDQPPPETLGLSRDVICLAWTGRSLLQAGHTEAAQRAYRRALELACQADPSRSPLPSFHDRPEIERFGLPLEALVTLVIRDLAAQGAWEFETWREVLPDGALGPLCAARVLWERGDPGVSAARALAESAAEGPTPEFGSEAVHQAAAAEALADARRWANAAEHYRQAIALWSDSDSDSDSLIERSWQYNLAEVLDRQGDPEAARLARRRAMVANPRDPITAQVIEARLQDGVNLVESWSADEDDPSDSSARSSATDW